MGTFDSTLKELAKNPGYCKAGEWLYALPELEAMEYMNAKNSGKYTLRTLYRALVKLGFDTTYETYRTHSNGECRCLKND